MSKVIYQSDEIQSSNLNGLSVTSVRGQLSGAFNIPSDAIAYLNDAPVSAQAENNTFLSESDTLKFVKPSGQKG